MTEPLPRTQYDPSRITPHNVDDMARTYLSGDAQQAAELARQLGEALTQIAALKRLIYDIAAADEAGLMPSKSAIRIAVKTIEAMK